MLKKISLDDSSYESVYENAAARIGRAAPWWTHMEASDPGITLLEMWSVLADMQSFYLDQVQESHYGKYLKLLGILPQHGKCAFAWVSFENVREDIRLPQGTKLTADKMVFETEEETELTSNSLCRFFRNRHKNKMEVMRLKRKTGFALEEGEFLFSFSLKKALKAGEKLNFFVLLDEGNKRNPLESDCLMPGLPGQDFFLVRLVWEYRTAMGWKAARVVRDDTKELLFSGCICLQTEDDMVARGDLGCEIRCRIAEGSYDVMPVIYKISLNVVRVIQRDTLCCYETAEFAGDVHRAELKSYLGKTGEIRVLRQRAGSVRAREMRNQGMRNQEIWNQEMRNQEIWNQELWQDITEECETDPPVKAVGEERHVYFPGEGKVKIVCMVPGAMSEYFPCPVNGVAAQKILLPWDNVIRESAEFLLAEGEDKDLYGTCRLLEEAEEQCSEYAWRFQEENAIVLGDGRHGEIPPASGKGLFPCTLALWEGSKGNVSIGRIKGWKSPELFPDIRLTNPLTGKGGEDRLSFQEQFQKFIGDKDRLARENRMVTEDDIRELVKRTPGLMIKDAKAVWKDGTVTVTAFPVRELTDELCVKKYRTCIRKYLERYRLLGTRVRVEIAGEK